VLSSFLANKEGVNSPAASQSAAAERASTPVASYSPPVTIPNNTPVTETADSAADQEESILDIDWKTIGLALFAIIAVGGLVPFWLWIWFSFNPPVM
jgi:serine/threonine-protein kinase